VVHNGQEILQLPRIQTRLLHERRHGWIAYAYQGRRAPAEGQEPEEGDGAAPLEPLSFSETTRACLVPDSPKLSQDAARKNGRARHKKRDRTARYT
jgi:hypothetical protein